MERRLPENVMTALRTLNNKGYQAYAVGGCVRDMARDVPPHDYDICTSALPEETKACFGGFRVIETGVKHGTVTVLIAGEALEITTFRTDGDYLDGRHPQSVAFTRSLEEDLRRRDFTMNAMAYHPDAGVVDLYGGQKDIERKLIRCVGDARTRLAEDALRILRALRFAAELGFAIDASTDEAMRALKGRLALISRERISAEVLRTVKAAGAARVMDDFAEVFFAALPSAKKGWEKGVQALKNLPAGDGALRLAALLHDNTAADIQSALASLKLPKTFENETLALTERAKTPFAAADAPLMLAQLGQVQLERLLLLQTANGTIKKENAAEIRRAAAAALARGLPMTLKALAVNGGDMMRLGIQGEMIGKTLSMLHESVLRGEIANDKRVLMAKAAIGQKVTVTVDRQLGTRHPKHESIVYGLNYGFVAGVVAPDGEEQDAYILGVDAPVEAFTGRVIAVILRGNDVEDKWIVAPEKARFTKDEIIAKTHFQEKFFDISVVL